MTSLVGQRFGNYRLIHFLGRGGFAEVYLGQHERLYMQVAIKVLRTSLTDEETEAFLREARTIASLEHPNILRILDFDVQDGMPFLVMSYASGGSLRQRHPKGTVLSLPTVISYVKQTAAAVQYAHDQKVIHRDLKPENLLLGGHEEVLLGDFGIALSAQSSQEQSTQNVAGTAAYMAPEQFQGKPRRATDQYALAVIVYEWLSGSLPFTGSFTELAIQHLLIAPRPLHEKVPTLPLEVEYVVLTALAKDPTQRWASVQAFATALDQASQSPRPVSRVIPASLSPTTMDSVPASHPAVSVSSSSSPSEQLESVPSSDSPGALTLPGAFLSQGPGQANPTSSSIQPLPAGLIHPLAGPTGSAVGASSSLRKESRLPTRGRGISRRKVLIGLAILTGVGAGAMVAGGIKGIWFARQVITYTGHSASVTSVAWSADGTRIASASFDGTVRVWDAINGGNALYTYTAPSHKSMWSVTWSPQRQFIVSGCDDGTAYMWDAINGGSAGLIYKGHADGVNAVQWSPDGQFIVSGSADNTAQVWKAQGGTTVVTHTGYAAPVTSVAWSPDSKYIVAGSRDKTVRIWDALTRGSARLTYKGHTGAVNGVAWSPDGKRIASGGNDNTVQVWNPTNGVSSITYKGHSDHVNPVSWSPDSKRIASGSWDRTVQVWNATSGILLFTYKGHSDHVNGVAWSPDGKRIASGSVDKTIQIWEVSQ